MSNDIRYDSRVDYIKINNIKSNCIINEYGTIWNIDNHKVRIPHKDSDENDAIYVTYLNKSSNKIVSEKTVSRLVAITFIPNPNNFKFINHIDGNIDNHHVSNLEWVYSTPEGLYSDRLIHKICKLLELEFTPREVAKELNLSIYFLNYIKYYKPNKWNEISSQYNIKRRLRRLSKEDEIHRICRLLEDRRYSISDIANMVEVSTCVVEAVKYEKAWTHISSQYNIPKSRKRTSKLDSYKNDVKEIVDCGIIDNIDILNVLDLPNTKENRKMISIIKHKMKKEKVQRLSNTNEVSRVHSQANGEWKREAVPVV
jgi:hypothetical protein